MQNESAGKDLAMEVAEDSRAEGWEYPSFVAELFSGNFRWDMLSPFPEQSAEDKRIGDEYIAKLKPVLEAHINPEKVDRTATVSQEALDALAEIGVFGVKIPKEYGGLGMSQVNYGRIMGFIGSYCASTGSIVSAHQSIGVPQPLKLFGTEEQKQKWLPRCASGAISAFALTEPGVGSDPAQMSTTATPTEDGEHYILNGNKLWCTNGPAADLLIVMAVTPPKMVNGREKKQISAFVVESDTPGFEVVHRCDFMGIRGIVNGHLRFNDMKIPAGNLVGKPGDGLKIALTTLNAGRLSLPCVAASGSRGSIHGMREWINERVQWGAPVGKHQAVAEKVATIAANALALDGMTWLSCGFIDKGQTDVRLEAAMAKYFGSQVAWQTADDFLQVRGGRGFETTESLRARGENPLPAERSLRNARIMRIVEGTDEIMKLFIAREAMDVHLQYILPIAAPKLAREKKPLMKGVLDAAKFYMGWYPKQWLPAGAPQAQHLNNANQQHLAYCSRTAKRLARSLFHTMARFGPKLEFEQLILANYVEIGTELFAMASALAYGEHLLGKDGDDAALQDLVDLFCRDARKRIEANFASVGANHNQLYNKVTSHLMEGKYEKLVWDTYLEDPPFCQQETVTEWNAAPMPTRKAPEPAAETPEPVAK